MEDSLVGKYFIIENRYFFSISAGKISSGEYGSSLFEYFPEDNNFKNIANFEEIYVINIGLHSE